LTARNSEHVNIKDDSHMKFDDQALI